MSKQKTSIPVGPLKCEVCTKTVFQMELVTIDGHIMHDKCFKCAHCNKKLSPTTCSSIYNKFYCKPHFMSLFKSKGNYNEGFGEEKDQHKFNAAHGVEPAKPAEVAKPAEPAKPAPTPAPAPTPVAKPAEPAKPAPAPTPAAKPAEPAKPAAAAKTPNQSYNSNTKKHTLENFSNNTDLTVTAVHPADGILISNCKGCVVTVSEKLSNISVLNCEDCGVIFDDIIAAVEINRSKKVQLQANGAVPQILLDNTSGATITLTEPAQSAQIITAQSELINLIVPKEDEDVEIAVPFQYVSRVVNGKLVTECAEHV